MCFIIDVFFTSVGKEQEFLGGISFGDILSWIFIMC